MSADGMVHWFIIGLSLLAAIAVWLVRRSAREAAHQEVREEINRRVAHGGTRSVEVRVCMDPVEGGLAFKGVDEVNELLAYGWSVLALEEPEAVVTAMGRDEDSVSLALTGCKLMVVMESRPIEKRLRVGAEHGSQPPEVDL